MIELVREKLSKQDTLLGHYCPLDLFRYVARAAGTQGSLAAVWVEPGRVWATDGLRLHCVQGDFSEYPPGPYAVTKNSRAVMTLEPMEPGLCPPVDDVLSIPVFRCEYLTLPDDGHTPSALAEVVRRVSGLDDVFFSADQLADIAMTLTYRLFTGGKFNGHVRIEQTSGNYTLQAVVTPITMGTCRWQD